MLPSRRGAYVDWSFGEVRSVLGRGSNYVEQGVMHECCARGSMEPFAVQHDTRGAMSQDLSKRTLSNTCAVGRSPHQRKVGNKGALGEDRMTWQFHHEKKRYSNSSKSKDSPTACIKGVGSAPLESHASRLLAATLAGRSTHGPPQN